ncbi:cytochrome c biogenesis protein CcdA [Arthrobacter sp. NPDC090010]|uniref:cytochrome c biogenesis protein CcdA n=1 Tax=Arthrobacter sp. NPDC090010 TaxID=3363942 RepID=UPI003823CC91
MNANILIGFLGGLITGISPCILPVLPVIFVSGGVDSARPGQSAGPPDGKAAALTSRWRPYQVIAGLALSFSVFTLLGSLILGFLGLPQDLFRWAGIAVLCLVGLGMIIPKLEEWLERPFSWIPRRQVDARRRGGFGLGLALGAVFVPCAGPVLAAIAVSGATGRIGPETLALTLSFAVGVCIPLLAFALAGRRLGERLKAFRRRQRGIRITAGALMIALAAGLALDLPAAVQRLIPDYTAGIQEKLSPVSGTPLDLGGLVTDQNKDLSRCTQGATELENCGQAPALQNVTAWLGSAPLSLQQLKGKVVLLDFWAYSCINCQRSLPHIIALDKAYRAAGLQVIGVHTPEYSFEREQGNVAAGMKAHGIEYPVAMDNSYANWTAYRNRFWPAQYLIDAEGTVRHIQQGEGGYATTEKLIRSLLSSAQPGVSLPAAVENGADASAVPADTTRETFLGVAKQVNYSGSQPYRSGVSAFSYPSAQPADSFALTGSWLLESQRITARPSGGMPSGVRLNYHARQVQLVAGGTGSLTLTTPAGTQRIAVDGPPGSKVLVNTDSLRSGTLEVAPSAGVQLYSFTFG